MRQIGSTIAIDVAGITVTTDSAITAVEIAMEAARRMRTPPTRARTAATKAASEVFSASGSTLTSWEQFVAHLSRPDRRNQSRLLHHLKSVTAKGSYVRRDELRDHLGFDGANGNLSLGGVCKGIIRRARSLGLDPDDVLQWSTLGYRAGRLVLSNALPEVAMS